VPKALLPLRSRKPPLNVAELRSVCAQRVAAGEAEQTVDLLLDIVEHLVERLDRLELQVKRLQHDHYARKSERLSTGQLLLALGETPAPLPLPPADPQSPTAEPKALAPGHKEQRGQRKLVSGRLPAHLPRIMMTSDPPACDLSCAECGAAKKLIGTETSEILEWEPGGFRVQVFERRKYACRTCQSGVVIGPAPVRVIEGALPGPGLIAELIVRKMDDHCPVERQSRIFSGRFGVPLSPSTLGDWFSESAELLSPVAKRIGEKCLSRPRLGLDDTGLPVLDGRDSRGIKKGHLWPFVSESEVLFVYTPSWQGKPIQELLKDFKGTLQTDGFAGLDALYCRPNAPIRAGCLAHLRRKFVQAFELGDVRASPPLLLIQKLYAIERQASEDALDAASRQRRREEFSRLLMAELRSQVDKLSYQAPPKTPLGRAITYALRQWDTLTVYLDDGALPIDNNHTERSLRPVGLGRRNWLFAGSDDGAKRLATLYTILGSCKLAGIADPWAYLRDVLDKLSRNWPYSRLDELLPQAWKAARTQV
jgi:transposase